MSIAKGLGKGVEFTEKQREKEPHRGFIGSLFRGRPDFSLLFPWPEQSEEDRVREQKLAKELLEFVSQKVNWAEIERTAEIPREVLRELGEMGFFALKVPGGQYVGRSLTQTSYNHIIGLLASCCPGLAIVGSADNTIGVKYPILKYGTDEQKKKYLPSLTKWPSGFCFTEKLVGSDPASMKTYALRVYNDFGYLVGYRMYGEKWYTTNAVFSDREPLAEYLAVVARIVNSPAEINDPNSEPCFGIFVVPTSAEGFRIKQRTEFMGMRGIYNAILGFNNVYLDKDQLIGKEGEGFKIALQALTTGRLVIASSCAAASKQALVLSRWWAMQREQWGKPIGKHEAIGSGKLVPAACDIFAMEAMNNFASVFFDRGGDVRLESATCKVFSSEKAWRIIDDMMQIFGGRGYEKAASLARREPAAPVEQIFRDARPNRIFEGSTEILSQWVMREGLDLYLQKGMPMMERGQWGKKLKAVAGIGLDYLKMCWPSTVPDCVSVSLRPHLKFVERTSREFIRTVLVFAGKFGKKFAYKQLSMARFFWIVTDLFAMSAVCAYATCFANEKSTQLADMFCREARRRIRENFKALKNNDDSEARKIAEGILAGEFGFLESGIVPWTPEMSIKK